MEYDGENAEAIAGEVLEVSGSSLWSGDFETFVNCFAFPHTLETFQGQRVVETAKDSRSIFDSVRAHYKSSGITEMVRHCVAAEFKDSNTIDSVHETRLVSGNVLTQAPFPVYSVLKFNGKCWQIVKSSYAIADSDRHNDALLGGLPPATDNVLRALEG